MDALVIDWRRADTADTLHTKRLTIVVKVMPNSPGFAEATLAESGRVMA